jgi:hypothetical protein
MALPPADTDLGYRSTAAVSTPSRTPYPETPTGSLRAGSRPVLGATSGRGHNARWSSRAIERAEKSASPGLSPTAIAMIVTAQSGRLSIVRCAPVAMTGAIFLTTWLLDRLQAAGVLRPDRGESQRELMAGRRDDRRNQTRTFSGATATKPARSDLPIRRAARGWIRGILPPMVSRCSYFSRCGIRASIYGGYRMVRESAWLRGNPRSNCQGSVLRNRRKIRVGVCCAAQPKTRLQLDMLQSIRPARFLTHAD